MTEQPETIWTVKRRGGSGTWKTYLSEAAAREGAGRAAVLGYTVELRKHIRGTPDHHVEVLIPAALSAGSHPKPFP